MLTSGSFSAPIAGWSHDYLEAVLEGSRPRALDIAAGAAREHSLEDVVLRVVLRTQALIGQMWEENRISILDEHVATAISEAALAELYRIAPRRPPNGIRVVVACVEGEIHELGARACADLLEVNGFDVLFAGAAVPSRDLVALCRRTSPQLVCLSVTMSFNVSNLRALVGELRESLPALKIAAGGHAFRWHAGLAAELDLVSSARDAAEFVADVKRIFPA